MWLWLWRMEVADATEMDVSLLLLLLIVLTVCRWADCCAGSFSVFVFSFTRNLNKAIEKATRKSKSYFGLRHCERLVRDILVAEGQVYIQERVPVGPRMLIFLRTFLNAMTKRKG